MSEAPIWIDDLAAPRWPLLWRLANRFAAPFAKRVVKLDGASLRDRPLIPASQGLDLRFDEFMADAVGSARRVCRFASLPAEATTRRRLEQYQAANPRGRHGTIAYRLEEFGLDAASLRARLRSYSDHFAVREE